MELDPDRLKLALRSQGYAVVPGAFSASDLEPLRQATQAMIDRWYGGEREDPDYWWFELEDLDGPNLYRIHNLETKPEPEIRALLGSSVLSEVVAAAFESPTEATQHALIVKLPRRGAEVPWHRDPVPVPPGTVYNFSIFLDDAPPETGCLEFVPESHFFPRDYPVAKERPPGSISLAASRGDVVIHDVRVVHGSDWNRSESLRRSVVVEYRPCWIQSLARRGGIEDLGDPA